MVLTETVEWKHLVSRNTALRTAIAKHCSNAATGPLHKVSVLPAQGDEEAEGLSATWYQVLCGMTAVGQLTAILAAGPPPEQVPEHERTNWVLSIAMQIQNEIMNVDLSHMLEGASILGAPVKGSNTTTSAILVESSTLVVLSCCRCRCAVLCHAHHPS